MKQKNDVKHCAVRCYAIFNSEDPSSAINLTSKIINSARCQNISPKIELHLKSIAGHTTNVDAHDQAFVWLKDEMLKCYQSN